MVGTRARAMSNPRHKHVTLQRPFVFFLRAMPFSLMKPWHKFLFIASVFGFVGYVTLSVAPRGDRLTQRESSSRALSLAKDVRAEDRNFLDNLVQKQSYDDHHSGNPPSAPAQNIDKAGTIVAIPKPVQRAELVINTEIVRRGELVIRRGTPDLSVRSPHLSRQQTIPQKP
jgi:hypothetical protein